MEKIYKIKAGDYQKTKNKIILFSFSFGLLFLVFIIYMVFIKNEPNFDIKTIAITSALILFSLIVPFVLLISKQIKFAKNFNETFRIILSDELIARWQKGIPVVKIKFSDIKAIYKIEKDAIYIESKNTKEIIRVPINIENIGELEDSLSSIKSFTLVKNNTGEKLLRYLLNILTVSSSILFITTKNKPITIITGVIIISMLIYSLFEKKKVYQIRQSPKNNKIIICVLILIYTWLLVLKTFKTS